MFGPGAVEIRINIQNILIDQGMNCLDRTQVWDGWFFS